MTNPSTETKQSARDVTVGAIFTLFAGEWWKYQSDTRRRLIELLEAFAASSTSRRHGKITIRVDDEDEIAASDAMEKALKGMLEAYEYTRQSSPRRERAWDKANAALALYAKAKDTK